MSDRTVAEMLARQVLGAADYKRDADVPAGLTAAGVEVRIDMRGMVHGISRSIWMNSAAIAQRVEDQLREAATEASIDAVIAEAVQAELTHLRATIRERVRKVVEANVADAIERALGDGPRQMARTITNKLWRTLYKGAPRRSTR